MFKLKSTIVTPMTIVWSILLILAVLSPFIVAMANQTKEKEVKEPQDTYTVDEVVSIRYEVMRDYQLQFLDNGKVAIYDGNRLVDVIPLDKGCNLTKVLYSDND